MDLEKICTKAIEKDKLHKTYATTQEHGVHKSCNPKQVNEFMGSFFERCDDLRALFTGTGEADEWESAWARIQDYTKRGTAWTVSGNNAKRHPEKGGPRKVANGGDFKFVEAFGSEHLIRLVEIKSSAKLEKLGIIVRTSAKARNAGDNFDFHNSRLRDLIGMDKASYTRGEKGGKGKGKSKGKGKDKNEKGAETSSGPEPSASGLVPKKRSQEEKKENVQPAKKGKVGDELGDHVDF